MSSFSTFSIGLSAQIYVSLLTHYHLIAFDIQLSVGLLMTSAQWWFVPEAEMQCNHLCESVCYLSFNADTKRIATPA